LPQWKNQLQPNSLNQSKSKLNKKKDFKREILIVQPNRKEANMGIRKNVLLQNHRRKVKREFLKLPAEILI
jgi:hypothetical protein